MILNAASGQVIVPFQKILDYIAIIFLKGFLLISIFGIYKGTVLRSMAPNSICFSIMGFCCLMISCVQLFAPHGL